MSADRLFLKTRIAFMNELKQSLDTKTRPESGGRQYSKVLGNITCPSFIHSCTEWCGAVTLTAATARVPCGFKSAHSKSCLECYQCALSVRE